MKGKLIVIEGGDGSGKTTQARKLVEHFQSRQLPVKYYDFPRYESFYGQLVARFLRGEFGDINQVSPYLASLPYALDRAELKNSLNNDLDQGNYVVTNRYVTSNLAHQAAKITSPTKRDNFVDWIETMEYKVNGLPKENIVIYLHVPWQVGMQLTREKSPRDYLNGKKEDIHEQDKQHRILTEQMYLSLAKKYSHWANINCFHNGKIDPPETIFQAIIASLQHKNII